MQNSRRLKVTHSVLHWFLDEVEALPARVKLVFVGAFEVQKVANDLKEWELEISIHRSEGTTAESLEVNLFPTETSR